MGERRRARSRSGFRRYRRFRGARRGVVAVVGTLLALLVFFALFGVFLTQYVPLWMTQNEAALSNQVQTSLATLKSGIDDQYLIGGIPTYSVPFTLSSASVPLLTQPTVASMSYIAGCPGGFYSNGTPREISACDFESLAYSTGTLPAGSQNHPYSQLLTTDYLLVSLPDRYYVAVTYVFEADGVAQAQSSSHQTMLVAPPVNVSVSSAGAVSVQSSLLALVGPSAAYSGQGSKDVTSAVQSASGVNSTDRFLTSGGVARKFNVTMIFGVHEICAWYNLLYNMSYAALGASSSTTWTLTGVGSSGTLALPPSSSVCAQAVTSTYDLTLKFYGVSSAAAFVSQSQLTFNAGGL
jgi:hypothetical protein